MLKITDVRFDSEIKACFGRGKKTPLNFTVGRKRDDRQNNEVRHISESFDYGTESREPVVRTEEILRKNGMAD